MNDTQRLDWLTRKIVAVTKEPVYGVKYCVFTASPDLTPGDEAQSNLRMKIDLAMRAGL